MACGASTMWQGCGGRRGVGGAPGLLLAAGPGEDLGGEEVEGAFELATDLAQVDLVEAGVFVCLDGLDVRRRVGAARRRDHVLGDNAGELAEMPGQREQLRGLAGDAVSRP